MTDPGTDIVPVGAYETGLEDLGDSLTVPRLRLDHGASVWRDPLTNEEFPELYAVILGLHKSRVLFDVVVGEGEVPMCKSPESSLGFPNMDPPSPKKTFPWAASGFDPNLVGLDEAGRVQVACGACKLKDWGSHPQGDKPWCSEQFTLPVLFGRTVEQVIAGEWAPGLLTFQKSSLKPLKGYLTAFKNKNVGAFTAITRMNLTARKAGSVVYSMPTFTRVGDTDSDNWPDYYEQFLGIKKYLTEQRPPAPDTGEQDPNGMQTVPGGVVLPGAVVNSAPTNNSSATPAPARPPMQSTPVSSPAPATTAPSSVIDDDDLPF